MLAETPKAFTSLSPGLRTLSALPWVTEREFRPTLKGLRRKGQVGSIREFSQSSMDSKSFVTAGRCPGLEFANAFGVDRYPDRGSVE